MSSIEDICSKANVRWNKIKFSMGAVLIDVIYLALNLAYKDFNKLAYPLMAIYIGIILCIGGSVAFQMMATFNADNKAQEKQEKMTKREILINVLFDLLAIYGLSMIPKLCNLFWSTLTAFK